MKNFFLALFIFLAGIKYSFSQIGVWSKPGNPFVASAGVNTLVEFNTELYVMGVVHLTKYNGNTWSHVSYVANPGTDKLWNMVVYNNELYACGSFTTFAGVPARNIIKYNGSTWSPVGGGLDTTATIMEVYNGELYVCGYSGQPLKNGNAMVKWNGSAWSGAGSVNTLSGTVYDMEVYMNELIATGPFSNIGGVTASNIARFNGSTWSAMGSGLSFYGRRLGTYNADLIVGGAFANAGGSPASRIAKWNGSSWSALGTGMAAGDVYTVKQYQTELYAGGTFSVAGGQNAVYIAKWNGSAWSDCGSTQGNQNCIGVYGSAIYQGALFVGGLFDGIANVLSGNIIKYQGPSAGMGEQSSSLVFSAYPNPACQFVNIKQASAKELGRIVLRDVNGRIVHQDNCDFWQYKMDLRNYAPGIYFLEILNDSGVSRQKLVVE